MHRWISLSAITNRNLQKIWTMLLRVDACRMGERNWVSGRILIFLFICIQSRSVLQSFNSIICEVDFIHLYNFFLDKIKIDVYLLINVFLKKKQALTIWFIFKLIFILVIIINVTYFDKSFVRVCMCDSFLPFFFF